MKDIVVGVKNDKKRESNIELYRIVLMILIIVHHYVVNSGLLELMYDNPLTIKSVFLFLIGAWGKIGINCFLLITGYFMCKSKITVKKFLKLILEVEFYKIMIYLLFTFIGVVPFEIKSFMKAMLPANSMPISYDFTGSYLLFYLFIPYINKLIDNLDKKEHGRLILLMFFVYSVFGNVPKINVVMNYITLYIYIYLIGAYIRLYPIKWFSDKKVINLITLSLVVLCMCSVICCLYIGERTNKQIAFYFVVDSNKILAVLTSISLFLFFKNLNIRYNRFINTIATSIFGVLLIHANSDAMRTFLWKTVLNNVGAYNTNYIYIHAILSVLAVFLICTIIDQIRIKFIEKTFFEKVVDKLLDKINKVEKNNN